MNIELTQEEMQNVRVCLVRVAKLPEFDEQVMKYLLMLSDKFKEPKTGEKESVTS